MINNIISLYYINDTCLIYILTAPFNADIDAVRRFCCLCIVAIIDYRGTVNI